MLELSGDSDIFSSDNSNTKESFYKMTPQKNKTSKSSLLTTKKKSSKVKEFSLNDDFKEKPVKKQNIS